MVISDHALSRPKKKDAAHLPKSRVIRVNGICPGVPYYLYISIYIGFPIIFTLSLQQDIGQGPTDPRSSHSFWDSLEVVEEFPLPHWKVRP